MPDPRVAEAYRAWFVYAMLNADTINGVLEAHDGAGFYEENFGWSVTLQSHAADLYGMPEYAARLLEAQLHFQQPDGLYTQACGLTDPGTLLIGLARHHAITGDDAWLHRVTPNILKLYSWLKTQRAAAEKTGPVRGLIKYRPYNDFATPVYNYLGNAWCAEGWPRSARPSNGSTIPRPTTSSPRPPRIARMYWTRWKPRRSTIEG